MAGNSVTGKGDGTAEGPLRGFSLDNIHKVRFRSSDKGNSNVPVAELDTTGDLKWVMNFLSSSIEGDISQKFTITQPNHGFAVLTAIYTDGALWQKARSDATGTLGLAIILEVPDQDTFIAGTLGRHTVNSAGLTAGQYYFVDDVVAGLLTTIKPVASSSFENPLMFAETGTTFHVLPFRPSQAVVGLPMLPPMPLLEPRQGMEINDLETNNETTGTSNREIDASRLAYSKYSRI